MCVYLQQLHCLENCQVPVLDLAGQTLAVPFHQQLPETYQHLLDEENSPPITERCDKIDIKK